MLRSFLLSAFLDKYTYTYHIIYFCVIFKLYFADTGLLVSMLDDESQEDLRANKDLGVYKGALYENIVGEALVKQHYKLYYYKKETSSLESCLCVRVMAFLMRVGGNVSKG